MVAPITYPSPEEFVIRAFAFVFAVAGLVVSVLVLLGDEQATPRRATRPIALRLGALSLLAIVVALVAA
jgi:hypothetical protein